MSWFNPAISQAPGSCLLAPCRTGERIKRVKARKLLGWNKTSLIGKTKAACTTEETQRITSVLPMGREMFSHFQESRIPSHLMVTWDNKHHHFKLSPFFLPPPTLSTDHHALWSGISLWSLSVTCPGCIFSQQCSPNSLTSMAVQKPEQALVLCKPFSAVTKTALYYQPRVQIQNTAPYQSLWRKLTLCQPKPAQLCEL